MKTSSGGGVSPYRLTRKPPAVNSPAGGTTLDQWLHACLKACDERLAQTQAQTIFFSGCRKIISPYRIVFTSLDDSLQLAHAGYTSNKMRMLVKNYLHDESRRVAIKLWKKRREQAKYGSVGFTTYAHFVKGDVKGATPRGSIFGPCIQSIVITWIDRQHYTINAFYRTTELFKKFPADLVFIRDVLLTPFNFKGMTMHSATFHFANVTAHPMYFLTLAPLMDHPIVELEHIRVRDPYFYKWIIRWSSRYLLKEHAHGIQKFSQAMRVNKDVNERIDADTLKELQRYLRDHHPGYDRRTETDDDEEAA